MNNFKPNLFQLFKNVYCASFIWPELCVNKTVIDASTVYSFGM